MQHHNVRRLVFAFISFFACVSGVWSAGRSGLSHLLSDQAMKYGRPALLNEAIRLNPSNTQAHYSRASALSQAGQFADATSEFESAVALRPSDYVLWLDLGSARKQVGDQEGALAAFNEAARLAPYYARPRWESGQLLLRAGRRDEAFEALRRAVVSRPALLAPVMDLAWKAFEGDSRAVQQAVQPRTDHERLVLARFFAERGRLDEAMQLFRAAGEVTAGDRRAFLNELLDARQFKQAYDVWSSGRPLSGNEGGIGNLIDGSFEGQIVRNDPSFGWHLGPRVEAVNVSLDTDQPRAGLHSLLLSFGGNARPSDRIITQLVLVEPRTHYRLSFAARGDEVITGGPPIVVVTDACSDDGPALAKSTPLPAGRTGWSNYSVEFTTKGATSAVFVAIQRENCTSGPCPIFGRVWFDAFSLQKE